MGGCNSFQSQSGFRNGGSDQTKKPDDDARKKPGSLGANANGDDDDDDDENDDDASDTDKDSDGDGIPDNQDTDSSNGPNGNPNGLDETEEQLAKPVPVSITFQRFGDNADWTNCVRIAINDEPEVEVGCNKDASQRTTTLKARRKPFCNKFRIALYSNGQLNFSTQNAGNVRLESNPDENLEDFKGFKFFKESNDVMLGLVNDNGDDKDHSDTTFKLGGLRAVEYKVENTSGGCQ